MSQSWTLDFHRNGNNLECCCVAVVYNRTEHQKRGRSIAGGVEGREFWWSSPRFATPSRPFCQIVNHPGDSGGTGRVRLGVTYPPSASSEGILCESRFLVGVRDFGPWCALAGRGEAFGWVDGGCGGVVLPGTAGKRFLSGGDEFFSEGCAERG